MDPENRCLMEFGNKCSRSETRTGTGRVTRRRILEEAYIVTKVYTSTSFMRLKCKCSIIPGGVTFKVTDYRMEEERSQKLMAERNL